MNRIAGLQIAGLKPEEGKSGGSANCRQVFELLHPSGGQHWNNDANRETEKPAGWEWNQQVTGQDTQGKIRYCLDKRPGLIRKSGQKEQDYLCFLHMTDVSHQGEGSHRLGVSQFRCKEILTMNCFDRTRATRRPNNQM